MTNAKPSGIITTVDAGIAHLVERHLAKVEVASSSLVARSSSQVTQSGGLFFCFWRKHKNSLPPPSSAPPGRADHKSEVGQGSCEWRYAICGMPGSEFEPLPAPRRGKLRIPCFRPLGESASAALPLLFPLRLCRSGSPFAGHPIGWPVFLLLAQAQELAASTAKVWVRSKKASPV